MTKIDLKKKKIYSTGNLVWFLSYEYGLSDELEQWLAIIVKPRNLLQNADIYALKEQFILIKSVPYIYLRTDKYENNN